MSHYDKEFLDTFKRIAKALEKIEERLPYKKRKDYSKPDEGTIGFSPIPTKENIDG